MVKDISLVKKKFDIEDLIISEMEETVGMLCLFSGDERVSFDFGDGVVFEIDEQDPLVPWVERLESLLDGVRFVCKETGMSEDYICEKLLGLDGWSWTKKTFRTPVWIDDFAEIPLMDAIDLKGELSWLERYL